MIQSRFSQSVQHMKVVRLPDGKYRFGQSNFDGEDALRRHFEQEKPIVGGDNSKSSFDPSCLAIMMPLTS